MSTRTSWTFRTLSLLVGLVAAIALPLGPALADGAGTAGSTPPGKGWIRAGHFIPGLGAAAVQLRPTDGSGSPVTMASPVSYGDVSAYQKVTPGTYIVEIRQADATASAPMLTRSLTVTSGTARTIALLGEVKQPRLAVLTDDLTPPPAGSARVRFLSGSSTTSMVSVMAVNGPTIASGVVLGESTGYTSVPQGSWTLNLSGGQGAVAQQKVSLASGSVYTAIALNSGTDKVRLELVTDAAGAMSTPRGGAATGEGGTATVPSAGLGVLVPIGGGLLAAAALLLGFLLLPGRRGAAER